MDITLVDQVWKTEHITSINKFSTIIDEFTRPRTAPNGDKEFNRFLYRGAADSNYSLVPSLARFHLDSRNRYPWMTKEHLYDIEQVSLDLFVSKAKLYADTGFLPDDLPQVSPPPLHLVLHWWQVMQHYHAPTRLLDWTTSPYVALYFAVVHNPDRDGIVWIVENGCIADRMSERYRFRDTEQMPMMWPTRTPMPTDNEIAARQIREGRAKSEMHESQLSACVSFFRAKSPTNRMCAQQGWLSCAASLATDHQQAIAEALKDHISRNWAMKVIISKSAKSDILRKLWAMNITAESLFPGLDGLGHSAAQIPDLYKPLDDLCFSLERGQLVTKFPQPK